MVKVKRLISIFLTAIMLLGTVSYADQITYRTNSFIDISDENSVISSVRSILIKCGADINAFDNLTFEQKKDFSYSLIMTGNKTEAQILEAYESYIGSLNAEDEIINLGFDLFFYNSLSDSGKNTVKSILAQRSFASVDEMRAFFNETVFVVLLSEASSVGIVKDLLEKEAGSYIDMTPYERLASDTKHAVCCEMMNKNYRTAEELQSVLYNCIDKVIKAQNTSSGGSGGHSTSQQGKAEVFIFDKDGNAFCEEPEQGEGVRLIIKPVYEYETSFVYAVAVYDKDERLKRVELFDSSGLQTEWLGAFKMYAQYDRQGKISVMLLDTMKNIKPLDLKESFAFSDCIKRISEQ